MPNCFWYSTSARRHKKLSLKLVRYFDDLAYILWKPHFHKRHSNDTVLATFKAMHASALVDSGTVYTSTNLDATTRFGGQLSRPRMKNQLFASKY
jgi:hypothetical protein